MNSLILGLSILYPFLFQLVIILSAASGGESVTYVPKKLNKTQSQAFSACYSFRVQKLARIKDNSSLQKSQEQISSEGFNPSDTFWTALSYKPPYYWNTWKSLESYELSNLRSILADQPPNNTKSCFLIRKNRSTLEPTDCNEEHFYICEKGVTYEPKYQKVNSIRAIFSCPPSSSLAKINDNSSLQKAQEQISSEGFNPSDTFWTALSYNPRVNPYFWKSWLNPQALNRDELSNLKTILADQPPNNRHSCFLVRENRSTLEPRDCSEEHYYLCEKVWGLPSNPSKTACKSLLQTQSTGAVQTSTVQQQLSSKSTTQSESLALTSSTLPRTPPPESSPSATSVAGSTLSTISTDNIVSTLTSNVGSTQAGDTLPTPPITQTSLIIPTTSRNVFVTPTTAPTTSVTTVVASPSEVGHTSTPSPGKPSAKDQFQQYQEKITALNVSQETSLQVAVNETSTILGSFEEETIDKNDLNVLLVTQELEMFAINFGKAQFKKTNNKDFSMSGQYFAMKIQKVQVENNDDVTFPLPNETNYPEGEGRASISLPSGLFNKQERLVLGMIFKDVDQWVPDESVLELDGKTFRSGRVGSRLISSAVDPHPTGVLQENVTIVFSYEKEIKDVPHCVFWNFSARTSFNGSWSTNGCTLVNKTKYDIVCSCNHLTMFAVLMQVQDKKTPTKHKLALEIITYIGCGLSLVGEFLTILAYCVLMNLKQEQSQIRLNLVVALAIAQIVFLTGIDSSGNQGACIVVAALIHFFYLVGFAWMLFEGVFLYLMVVKVFNTVVRMRLFYGVAWGLPLLVVVTSLVIASTNEGGVSSYVHGDFCWISFKNNLIWAFAAPVLAVCLINSVILACVVYEITKMQSAMTSEVEKARQGLKACAVLFPLLGMTWVFGILSVTDAGLVFQYLFTILNSLQGFFIFVLHVLRSSDVHAAFQRKKQKWKEAKGFATYRFSNGSFAMQSANSRVKLAGSLHKMTSEASFELSPRKTKSHRSLHTKNLTPLGRVL